MSNLGLFDDGDTDWQDRSSGDLSALGQLPVDQPLPERLRPVSLADVVGQSHLLGVGKPLRQVFETGRLHSMILWGPPGVGKTTLALLLAKASGCELIALSAVFSGVKDIRAAMEQAQRASRSGAKTVLFIDEIHRFNKSQQDALLPYVESGLVTFIGATTENPSFEVNSALLSRSQVYVLESLKADDFKQLLRRAVKCSANPDLELEDSAFDALHAQADGDARRFLNLVELCLQYAQSQRLSTLTVQNLQALLPQTIRRFDKGGDAFYDQISALHKSVRGSDPNAALYWFCRMLEAGTDPRYLARRLVRMAWEDIGLADPRALQLANDAASTYERLGSPEGDLALAETVIYLAIAPKSNAAYQAFKSAMNDAKRSGSLPVPMHLRNAPTALMKNLGHGQGYRYAHDETDGLAAGESYWPSEKSIEHYYQPVNRGLEIKIGEKLQWLAERNAQAKPD